MKRTLEKYVYASILNLEFIGKITGKSAVFFRSGKFIGFC